MNRKKIYEHQFSKAYNQLNEFVNPSVVKKTRSAWYDHPHLQTAQDVGDVASLGLAAGAIGTAASGVGLPASPFLELGSTGLDLANAGVYGARAVGALVSGDYGQAGSHALDAGLRGLAAIPYGGTIAQGGVAARTGPRIVDNVSGFVSPTRMPSIPTRPRPSIPGSPRTPTLPNPNLPKTTGSPKTPTLPSNPSVPVPQRTPKLPGGGFGPGVGTGVVVGKMLRDYGDSNTPQQQEKERMEPDVTVNRYKGGEFEIAKTSEPFGSAIQASISAAQQNDNRFRRSRMFTESNRVRVHPSAIQTKDDDKKKEYKFDELDVIKFKPGVFDIDQLRKYISIFHANREEGDLSRRVRGIHDYFRKPGLDIAKDYARSHWNLSDSYNPTGNILENIELYGKIKRSVNSYLKSKEGKVLNDHLNNIKKNIDNH